MQSRSLVLFVLGWLMINLIQVSYTELTSDEGYYWFYAQHLQLGYYDHPPMIALLIKAGLSIFPGELGVRFFNVALSTAGLFLFLKLLPTEWKNSFKTYVVLLSAPLLHYLCFIVFPDGPLLFFSLVFLVGYKRFLNKATVGSAIFLGLSIALMAWSKYHGVLVLLFTIMANPKLLKSFQFYLSLTIALLFFAPHLWWQYQNDFPTLKYHLSGRTGSLSFKHVGEYVSQQLLAIGPGLIFVPFVSRTKDVFERTLKFIIIGTFVFFLASSFKTFVHFHWTSVALFPILYFAVRYYHQAGSKRLFNALIIPFVVIFFIARILLAVPFIPNMHVGEDYYHGRKIWAQEIKSVAGDKPVLMPNNLREASLYSFYSGRQGITLYTRREKKSQYELWGYEDSLQGKAVMLLTEYPFAGSKEFLTSTGQKHYYNILPHLLSYYNSIAIEGVLNRFRPADTVITATLMIRNERKEALSFGVGKNELPFIVYSIEQNNKIVQADTALSLTPVDNLPRGKSMNRAVAIPIKYLPRGEYQILFGIRSGVLPDAILSLPLQFSTKSN